MGYYLQEDGVSKFVLEDGSGDYSLESGGTSSIAPNRAVALTRMRPRATQWGALGGLDAPSLAAAPGDPESGGIAGAGAVSPPTVVNASSPPPTPISACYDDFRAFIADLEASTEYTDWCSAEPGDCATWTTYSRAILAGGSPSPPAMSTTFGTALVDAGIIALDGIASCRASRAPHAAFSFSVAGLTVTFTNLSIPGPDGWESWNWTFGDGGSDSSSLNPVHTYAGVGTYIVTLTLTGAGGDGITSVTHLVTVYVPNSSGFHIDAVSV